MSGFYITGCTNATFGIRFDMEMGNIRSVSLLPFSGPRLGERSYPSALVLPPDWSLPEQFPSLGSFVRNAPRLPEESQ